MKLSRSCNYFTSSIFEAERPAFPYCVTGL